MIKKVDIYTSGIFILFGIIFTSISIPNHVLLRTHALDLGMFNHALYQFSQFQMANFSLSYDGEIINYFSDHFSPITLFFVPFYYLFGAYTLLIIQILSILWGGYGIWKYLQFKSNRPLLNRILLLHFFVIWGTYSALSFDFHTNVIASMFVPWILYYFEKGQVKWTLILLILLALCKENMALWSIFIYIGLLLKKYLKNRQSFQFQHFVKFELSVLVGLGVYFLVVVGYVMPHLNEGNVAYQLSRDGHLGNSTKEIIYHLLSQPNELFNLLFENTSGEPEFNGIKTELMFMVLVSGGFLLFYQPIYLLMLIPIFAQKMLANNYAIWGISGQYSIEFVPVLSLCVIDFVLKLKAYKWQMFTAILTVIFTAYFNYRSIESRHPLWFDNTNTAFYDAKHYQSPLPTQAILQKLKSIPDGVSVSASSALTPHLEKRRNLFLFPNVNRAKYILLLDNPMNTYPCSYEEFVLKRKALLKNERYQLIYQKNALSIFKRKI